MPTTPRRPGTSTRTATSPCRHAWNTAVHAADYEGRPVRRSLRREELQAFLRLRRLAGGSGAGGRYWPSGVDQIGEQERGRAVGLVVDELEPGSRPR